MKSNTNTLSAQIIIVDTEEQTLMVKLAQKGDITAKEKLVNSCLPLVTKYAKKYYSKMGGELEDLISAGTLSLIKAIDRFDLNNGAKFSTFATYSIERGIKDYAFQSLRCVATPNEGLRRMLLVDRAEKHYESIYHETPTAQKVLEIVTDWEPNIKITEEGVKEYMILNKTTPTYAVSSLDAIIDSKDGSDSAMTLHDIIPDQSVNIKLELDKKRSYQILLNAVDALPETQKNILYLRYGLNDLKEKGYIATELMKVEDVAVQLTKLEGRDHKPSKQYVNAQEHIALDRLAKNKALREIWEAIM